MDVSRRDRVLSADRSSEKVREMAFFQELLEKEFLEKEVTFVQHLNVTNYPNKQFAMEDIDGRWLAFGLKIKEDGEKI